MKQPDGTSMMPIFSSIRAFYKDAAKLIVAAQNHMGTRGFVRWDESDSVTREISTDLKQALFMADGLFRRWVKHGTDRRSVQEAVVLNLLFFDDTLRLDQPIAVVSALQFDEPTHVNQLHWASWDIYKTLEEPRTHGAVHEVSGVNVRGRNCSGRILSVPLFSLEDAEDVSDLFQRLGIDEAIDWKN